IQKLRNHPEQQGGVCNENKRNWGCTPKPSKIPSKWISDFHSLVQPSFADIGSIFTATIPFVAEELRSISMRCWQTWHWKKPTKGSLKPSNYGFDPIRPRNVMINCLTEFSRVWAYNPDLISYADLHGRGSQHVPLEEKTRNGI